MTKSKIFDCITFFDENFLVNSRFEILKDVVDYFVICLLKMNIAEKVITSLGILVKLKFHL